MRLATLTIVTLCLAFAPAPVHRKGDFPARDVAPRTEAYRCYDEGYAANKKGWDIDDNPYSKNQESHKDFRKRAWEQGWATAEAEKP